MLIGRVFDERMIRHEASPLNRRLEVEEVDLELKGSQWCNRLPLLPGTSERSLMSKNRKLMVLVVMVLMIMVVAVPPSLAQGYDYGGSTYTGDFRGSTYTGDYGGA